MCPNYWTQVNIRFESQVNDTMFIATNQSNNDSYIIETFKFYISDLSFYRKNQIIYKSSERFLLVDLINPSKSHFILEDASDLNFDEVRFSIGIDSLTNYKGVSDGALDPLNGMYWTWKSGYINFKLEGELKEQSKKFQYHIGGYQYPEKTLQDISLKCNFIDSNNLIIITIDLDQLFESLPSSFPNVIMSTGENAKIFAGLLPPIFSIQTE